MRCSRHERIATARHFISARFRRPRTRAAPQHHPRDHRGGAWPRLAPRSGGNPQSDLAKRQLRAIGPAGRNEPHHDRRLPRHHHSKRLAFPASAQLFERCLQVDLSGVASVRLPYVAAAPQPGFIGEGAAALVAVLKALEGSEHVKGVVVPVEVLGVGSPATSWSRSWCLRRKAPR
jgi:hypothetical protein